MRVDTTEHQPPQRHQKDLFDVFCWSRFLPFSLQPEMVKSKQVLWITAAVTRFTQAVPPTTLMGENTHSYAWVNTAPTTLMFTFSSFSTKEFIIHKALAHP